MARKLRKMKQQTLSSATPDNPNIPQPGREEPGPQKPRRPYKPTGRPPGRPRKNPLPESSAPPVPKVEIRPEALVPVTTVFLGLVSAFVKGDTPTKGELDTCNLALTAVVNKHAVEFKYAEEILLVIAVGNAGMAMAKRGKEKRVASSDSGDRRNEGFGEKSNSTSVPGPVSTFGGN